jgi:hypothetical protein
MQESKQDRGERLLLLSDLLGLLWRRRAVIAECALGAMFLMTIGLFVIQPKYRVTATIIEKQDETTEGMRNFSSSLSSLSSGILGGRSPLSNNFQQFLNLLTEPVMLDHLPQRDIVLHTVFKKEWDPQKNAWRENNGPISLFNMLFGLPRKPPPDAQRLSEYLKKQIVVAPVDSGPLYEIYIDWRNPVFATNLLSALIHGADEILRARRAEELKAREAFLTAKLNQTTGVEQRQALAQIFSRTILSQAILYQNPYYTVSIVQPPAASSIPVSPVPFLYLVFAGVGGAMIGCTLLFVGVLTSGVHPRDYGRQPRSWLSWGFFKKRDQRLKSDT